MTKSEAMSWYRIEEIFRFQAFHMYGIIGSALAVGVIMSYIIKQLRIKTLKGRMITFKTKDFSMPRCLFGGIIFGFYRRNFECNIWNLYLWFIKEIFAALAFFFHDERHRLSYVEYRQFKEKNGVLATHLMALSH
jgi:hypothetical protein